MSRILFDDNLRRIRHDRAVRSGGDAFLHERAFGECLDRLGYIRRTFATARFAGFQRPEWRPALAGHAAFVQPGDSRPFDPSSLVPQSIDLCLSIGDLDAINDLSTAAFALRQCLRPGGLLIGAIVGGNSLPRLRSAMLAADRIEGRATPHVHPAIDGPSLGALLTSAGLVDPVIDVDRIEVTYPSLDRLVTDLRAMGCTNILADRSKSPLSRRALAAARSDFLAGADQAIEQFELLHFAAWAPEN